jgi:RNA recognition motif-containing protein
MIYSIKLHIDSNENTKEYAYIQFSTRESADEAKKNLHKTEFKDSVLEVDNYKKQYFKPKSGDLNCLFVKGFPEDTSDEEFVEEFKQYGLVEQFYIVPGKDFGFVSFSKPSQAEDAIIKSRD